MNCSTTMSVLFSVVLASGTVSAAPRDVQIRSVDIDAEVVGLFNFGDVGEPLDGWRICSQDSLSSRCTGSNGLNGVAIEAGTSLFVHLRNNGPGGPDHLNANDLGGAFADIDERVFAIQLFFPPVDFGDGMTMADHLQWARCKPPVGNVAASSRSDEAVAGGLWTDEMDWILIGNSTLESTIELVDSSGGIVHGPDDYSFCCECPGSCRLTNCPQCDLDGDGVVTGLDIAIIVSSANWSLMRESAAEPCADANRNGIVEGLDVSECLSGACWGQ